MGAYRSLAFVLALTALQACALRHGGTTDASRDVTVRDVEAGQILDGDAARDGQILDADASRDVETGCGAGLVLCSGTCTAVDTARRCGTCDNDCTALPGANAATIQCVAGACDLGTGCQAGLGDCDHIAANGCETQLTSATHCGLCGTACSGGTPVCVLNASNGTHRCESGCAAGQTLCPSGACANLTSDVSNCGTCGTICSAPSGGSAHCMSSACSWTCNTGLHPCGAACLSNDSPLSCGASCTPCTPPANATATCSGTACGFTCNAGFHNCGGACVSNTSTATCGTSCTACPSVPNGSPTCGGVFCGIACNTGFHDCGGSCLSDTSTNSCGSGCAPCIPPANATATCTGGSCGFMCNSGFGADGGVCLSSTCGNRMLDASETCDDGNTTAGDGCSASCRMESGVVGGTCPAAAAITITRPGIYIYTGDTTGGPNNITSCGSGGPEQGLAATFNTGSPVTVTVTLQPTTWDPALRHGPVCGSLSCTEDRGPGQAETYTLPITPTPFTEFWVIDGKGGNPSGPWTLTVDVR